MSFRLWLYTVGARLLVRPVFKYTHNPIRAAKRMDRLAAAFVMLPPYSYRLERPLGGRPAHFIRGRGADGDGIILFFHGGGYFAGSGKTHSAMLARLSAYAGVPVFAQDYRLSRDEPFPAAFDDAVAAWDDLIARGYRPDQIVIGGDSAGGGLALSLLATLSARGERPAGLFAFSPWTDLTMSGPSVIQVGNADPVLPADRMTEAAQAYYTDTPPNDVRVSPLFATYTSPPPVFMQVGSPEVLSDDTYRMAEVLRKAGGQVDVQTWDKAPHVWHLGELWVPEARAALRDTATFVQDVLSVRR